MYEGECAEQLKLDEENCEPFMLSNFLVGHALGCCLFQLIFVVVICFVVLEGEYMEINSMNRRTFLKWDHPASIASDKADAVSNHIEMLECKHEGDCDEDDDRRRRRL